MKAALGSVGGKKERQQQQQRQQQQLQQLQHQQQQEAAAAAVLEAPSPSLSPPLPPTVLLHSMPLSVPMTMEEGKGEGVGEEQQQQHQGGIQVDVVEEVEQQQSPLLSTPLPPPPLVAPPPLVSASGESKRGDRREDEEEIWSGGSEEEPYFTFSPSSLPPECYGTQEGREGGREEPWKEEGRETTTEILFWSLKDSPYTFSLFFLLFTPAPSISPRRHRGRRPSGVFMPLLGGKQYYLRSCPALRPLWHCRAHRLLPECEGYSRLPRPG